MPSPFKKERVNSLLEHEISKLVLREVFFPKEMLVTVTRVEVTDNLTEAKVFVSVYPAEKSDYAFKTLKRETYNVQYLLNRTLRTHPIPKIRFIEDTAIQQADRVEELLHKLKTEEK
jgi:ribosome-binding factor A